MEQSIQEWTKQNFLVGSFLNTLSQILRDLITPLTLGEMLPVYTINSH